MRHPLHTRPGVLFALCIAALLLVSGCAPKKRLPRPTPVPREATRVPAKSSLLAQAENAWSTGNTARSEILFGRLLDSSELTAAERVVAWERYTLSALKNNHPHLALEALPKWLAADARVIDSPVYQNAYFEAIKRIGNTPEALKLLQSAYGDAKRPWRMRVEAGLLLAGRHWQRGEPTRALDMLASLYRQARSDDYRAALEQRMFQETQGLDDSVLIALADATPEGDALFFPYVVLEIERARRLAASDDTWPRAWQRLRRILAEGKLADKQLVTSVLIPLEREKGQPVQGLVLALPLTGKFGGVGWKILRGAGVAQWGLAQSGIDLSLQVVNTAAPGWTGKILDMPAAYTVVGGPVRVDAFKELKAEGMLDKRAYFTFLPGLGESEEGKDAWRFFSGPRDQARSLLHLAKDGLGITSFGSLAPDEPYGRRMAELFAQEVYASNATMNATATYAPRDFKSWGKVIGDMLGVPPKHVDEEPLPPEPPFEAVFVPDGWNNAELIAPHFFFHQEERMVFLGPTLWGQALVNKTDLDTRYFSLAVFPGAWWPENGSEAAVTLRASLQNEGLGRPDFWVALGYDFVRFAGNLGPLPPGWTPEDVNPRVYAAQDMSWSMAPLYYDQDGTVGQELFMFTPTSRGPQLEDTDLLRRRLERARDHHERRVQVLTEKKEEALLKLQQGEESPKPEETQ